MISPELNLKFQQTFKMLQIHAGLGVTEDNISKITDITENLYGIARKLFWEVYPQTVEPELPYIEIENLKPSEEPVVIEEKPIVKSKK